MGWVTQLFIVVTLFAVLHSAPLDSDERSSVDTKPLSATATKTHDSEESGEDDRKGGSRHVRSSPLRYVDQQTGTSTQTVPTNRPQTEDPRKVREITHPHVDPAPPPPPPHVGGPPPPHAGGPPPPHAGGPPPPPSGRTRDIPRPPPPSASRPARDIHTTFKPQTLPARTGTEAGSFSSSDNKDTGNSNRQVRDTQTTIRPATLPARIDGSGTPSGNSGSRHVRDTSSTVRPQTLPARIGSATGSSSSSNNKDTGNSNRQVRDTQTTVRPAVIPARIGDPGTHSGTIGNQPRSSVENNRRVRDLSASSTTASSTTETSEITGSTSQFSKTRY